jgi:hypothetical protein
MPAAKTKENFTPADVTSICDAAQAAWDAAKPTARKVTFVWRGHKYQSRLTNMRMLVETYSGEPIAARYH